MPNTRSKFTGNESGISWWVVCFIPSFSPLYSASSSPLLFRSAPDTARILCIGVSRRSAACNCELRTCPRSLHGGLIGIRTHDPPVGGLRLYQCATTLSADDSLRGVMLNRALNRIGPSLEAQEGWWKWPSSVSSAALDEDDKAESRTTWLTEPSMAHCDRWKRSVCIRTPF